LHHLKIKYSSVVFCGLIECDAFQIQNLEMHTFGNMQDGGNAINYLIKHQQNEAFIQMQLTI
jgi:hypothetical protein